MTLFQSLETTLPSDLPSSAENATSAGFFSDGLSGFSLSDTRIHPKSLQGSLANAQAGALVTFEGWVRNHNDGRSVERLDYEAFEPLAQAEGERVIQEALNRFDILNAYCVHRTGRLIIGECAVWVGVTSAHRDAAFQAARYIIDQIKSRLPIWKKEHYVNGDAVWVNCQQCSSSGNTSGADRSHHKLSCHDSSKPSEMLDSDTQNAMQEERSFQQVAPEALYYQRQVILPEVGLSGQQKLKNSKILVVGAGGLGSAALLYLAGAGVGCLGVVDFDRLEASNLHRQVLYNVTEIGQYKSILAARRLKALNPHIEVLSYTEKVSRNTIEPLLSAYDLILDCTDNFETRFLLNEAAMSYKKPLIQASIYQYEGQIQLIGSQIGGCLQCQWPQGSDANLVPSCSDAGVLGAVSGIFGAMQAMEALKVLLDLPGSLKEQLLMVNLLTWQSQLIRRRKRPDCPVCSPVNQAVLAPQILDSDRDEEWLLSFNEANLKKLQHYTLVDVSESREHHPIDGVLIENIPFSCFDLEHPPLSLDKTYLLYCKKGVRSEHLVRELRQRGLNNVFALKGGLLQQDLNAFYRSLVDLERSCHAGH